MAVSKSFSSLDLFLDCERRFYYRKIARLKEPPSLYFCVGNLYHAAIEADLMGELDLEAEIHAAMQKSDWSCPSSAADLEKEINHNLERLREEVFPYLDIKFTECWSKDINASAQYCAKLDAYSTSTPIVEDGTITGSIEDQPCVVDWKTIFGSRRRSQEDANSSPQLALYCLEAKTNHAAFVEIPRYTGVPINTIVVAFTDEELAYWEKWFNVQFLAMSTRGQDEKAYRLSVPGNYRCSLKWCPYWRICPGGGADDPTK